MARLLIASAGEAGLATVAAGALGAMLAGVEIIDAGPLYAEEESGGVERPGGPLLLALPAIGAHATAALARGFADFEAEIAGLILSARWTQRGWSNSPQCQCWVL